MSASQQPSSRSLFNWLVLLTIVAVLIGVFVYYVTQILSETKSVLQEQALSEFQRTNLQVHGQWLADKADTVTLTQLDAQLNKGNAVTFEVNEFGWPVAVTASKVSRCLALFEAMHTQELNEQVTARASENLSCTYYINGELWFYFDVTTGKVQTKV